VHGDQLWGHYGNVLLVLPRASENSLLAGNIRARECLATGVQSLHKTDKPPRTECVH
jgi:hypothetical protein